MEGPRCNLLVVVASYGCALSATPSELKAREGGHLERRSHKLANANAEGAVLFPQLIYFTRRPQHRSCFKIVHQPYSWQRVALALRHSA